MQQNEEQQKVSSASLYCREIRITLFTCSSKYRMAKKLRIIGNDVTFDFNLHVVFVLRVNSCTTTMHERRTLCSFFGRVAKDLSSKDGTKILLTW